VWPWDTSPHTLDQDSTEREPHYRPSPTGQLSWRHLPYLACRSCLERKVFAYCSWIKNRNAQLRDAPALRSHLPCGVRHTDVAVFSISQGPCALHPETQGKHQIHFQGNSPRKTSLPDVCHHSINSFHSAALSPGQKPRHFVRLLLQENF